MNKERLILICGAGGSVMDTLRVQELISQNNEATIIATMDIEGNIDSVLNLTGEGTDVNIVVGEELAERIKSAYGEYRKQQGYDIRHDIDELAEQLNRQVPFKVEPSDLYRRPVDEVKFEQEQRKQDRFKHNKQYSKTLKRK